MKFTPLSPADLATLDSDREFATAVMESRFQGESLSGTQRDIPCLQRILDSGPYTDSAEEELIALGTTLGDLLGRALGMTWVRFTNEQGDDLALRYADTSIVIFPRDMIIKRVENDEQPDIQHIYTGVISEVQKLISSGQFQ
jgi:hypothetical protein